MLTLTASRSPARPVWDSPWPTATWRGCSTRASGSRPRRPAARSGRTAPPPDWLPTPGAGARAWPPASVVREPLSIQDRRVIASRACEVLRGAVKPAQTYRGPGREQGRGIPARARRAGRSGTWRAYLMFRVTGKTPETAREQQQQQSGRRESNSRSQLGNLVGDCPRTCAGVCSDWSATCSRAGVVRRRPLRHHLIGHVAGTTCSACGLRATPFRSPRWCGDVHPSARTTSRLRTHWASGQRQMIARRISPG